MPWTISSENSREHRSPNGSWPFACERQRQRERSLQANKAERSLTDLHVLWLGLVVPPRHLALLVRLSLFLALLPVLFAGLVPSMPGLDFGRGFFIADLPLLALLALLPVLFARFIAAVPGLNLGRCGVLLSLLILRLLPLPVLMASPPGLDHGSRLIELLLLKLLLGLGLAHDGVALSLHPD